MFPRLQVTFNFDEVIEKAYQVGRQGSLKENLLKNFLLGGEKLIFLLMLLFVKIF